MIPNSIRESGTRDVITANYALRLRVCAAIICVSLVPYLAFVVLPFFAYGIHLLPSNLVAGGVFDPKGYPIYTDAVFGAPLRLITLIALPITPALVIAFGGFLLMSLPRGLKRLTRAERVAGVLVISASLAFVVMAFSPLGMLIMRWHMD